MLKNLDAHPRHIGRRIGRSPHDENDVTNEEGKTVEGKSAFSYEKN